MKYQIFQIRTTEAEVDLINKTGDFNAVPKFAAKRDLDFAQMRGTTIEALAKEFFDKGYYTHVANIAGSDLENVFHIGNMGPEENIERLDRMHSISVGDLVLDENNILWVVANFGFNEVCDLEVA
jgi:hypothetical protein